MGHRASGWTSVELGAVAPGMQPVTVEGLLVCLECGRAFRQLGQHVVAAHRVSVGQYRADHGLPAGYGLHCEATRAARSDRGRRLWQQDPALRERLRPTRTTAAERAELGRRARAATASRAGVREAARDAVAEQRTPPGSAPSTRATSVAPSSCAAAHGACSPGRRPSTRATSVAPSSWATPASPSC